MTIFRTTEAWINLKQEGRSYDLITSSINNFLEEHDFEMENIVSESKINGYRLYSIGLADIDDEIEYNQIKAYLISLLKISEEDLEVDYLNLRDF